MTSCDKQILRGYSPVTLRDLAAWRRNIKAVRDATKTWVHNILNILLGYDKNIQHVINKL
jgi:hypothetical protein